MKVYIKIEITIKKSGNIETPKLKFHEHKGAISIKKKDINKRVVSNMV